MVEPKLMAFLAGYVVRFFFERVQKRNLDIHDHEAGKTMTEGQVAEHRKQIMRLQLEKYFYLTLAITLVVLYAKVYLL